MYVVIETQTNAQGQIAVLPPVAKATIEEARNAWHTILAAAAISTVPKHAASILDDELLTVARECYVHEVEPNE